MEFTPVRYNIKSAVRSERNVRVVGTGAAGFLGRRRRKKKVHRYIPIS